MCLWLIVTAMRKKSNISNQNSNNMNTNTRQTLCTTNNSKFYINYLEIKIWNFKKSNKKYKTLF